MLSGRSLDHAFELRGRVGVNKIPCSRPGVYERPMPRKLCQTCAHWPHPNWIFGAWWRATADAARCDNLNMFGSPCNALRRFGKLLDNFGRCWEAHGRRRQGKLWKTIGGHRAAGSLGKPLDNDWQASVWNPVDILGGPFGRPGAPVEGPGKP